MKQSIFLLCWLALFTPSLCPTFAQSAPARINGLETRRGQELTAAAARQAARVSSLQAEAATKQSAQAATTDPTEQAKLQSQVDRVNQSISAAQAAQQRTTAQLAEWQAETLATHGAATTSIIDWTHGTISAKSSSSTTAN